MMVIRRSFERWSPLSTSVSRTEGANLSWNPGPALFSLWAMLLGAQSITAQDSSANLEQAKFSDVDVDFFEAKIRPLLKQHCWECHSRDSQSLQAGLSLDSRAAVLRGGDSGPAAVAGDADESLLLAAVRYDRLQMPPRSRLSPAEVELLTVWIGRGLPWGAEQAQPPPGLDQDGVVEPAQIESGKSFWSLTPLRRSPLPSVSDRSWPATRIDHFILAGLDAANIKPSQETDRRTLIRRLSFDLVGLPPSSEEVQRFVEDRSPTATEELVERLLASPAYGQHWGRYWLDVVRYAEDHPNGALPPRYAHRYRDWVCAALNDDLRFDDFIRRQLAADQLPDLPLQELAALGLLGLSPTYVIDEKFATDVVKSIKADEWEEKVDMITRGLLGLTVACARCHDHKYDPITTADYYALAGVMASTQLVELPTVPMFPEDCENLAGSMEQLRFHENRYQSRLKQRQGLIKDGEPDIHRYDKEILESASEIQRITSLLPDNYASIPRVNAVRDAAERVNPEFYVIRALISPEAKFWRQVEYEPGKSRDLRIHIRGSSTQLGESVPRRFISLLSPEEPVPFQHGSGRLELANAIVGQAQQLVARVLVNRIWGWHFGSHLVGTPSNFGFLGDRPTHPELLDDLACRFIEQGWSLKQLHREIMLSATYRQSSCYDATSFAIDPSNTLYWRMPERRLTVEAWRDAILKVAGRLDAQVTGPSFDLQDLTQVRRTVFGRTSRQGSATLLKLFDFPELTRHTESRSITTTPLQQLYFMNSPFVIEQAETIAKSFSNNSDVEQVIVQGFQQILQRAPSTAELGSSKQFLATLGSQETDAARLLWVQALLSSNAFMFVD